MLSTPIGRLRAIGLIEGIYFLLLLFVAMPLKYFAGFATAVKITRLGSLTMAFYVFIILNGDSK